MFCTKTDETGATLKNEAQAGTSHLRNSRCLKNVDAGGWGRTEAGGTWLDNNWYSADISDSHYILLPWGSHHKNGQVCPKLQGRKPSQEHRSRDGGKSVDEGGKLESGGTADLGKTCRDQH